MTENFEPGEVVDPDQPNPYLDAPEEETGEDFSDTEDSK